MKFNIVFCVAGVILLNIADGSGTDDSGVDLQQDQIELVCGQAPLNTKIVGGQNAIEGSWPWQACIQTRFTETCFCSGSLISKEWVLSVTACFKNVLESDIEVYLGRLTQDGSNPDEISRTVTKIIKHPESEGTEKNLALLKLSSPVTFTDYIKPVCLAAAGSVFVEGTESWVAGWGVTDYGESAYPDILQELETPVVNTIDCNKVYGGEITNNLICAGFLSGEVKSPCVGDRGSPLVSRQGNTWIQSGVLFSLGCFLPAYPAVYIRVSEFQDWISNYTNSSMPGFVQFPLIPSVGDGGSINLLPFSLALSFSIIPFIFLHFFKD